MFPGLEQNAHKEWLVFLNFVGENPFIPSIQGPEVLKRLLSEFQDHTEQNASEV